MTASAAAAAASDSGSIGGPGKIHHAAAVAELTSHFADLSTGHLQLHPLDAAKNSPPSPSLLPAASPSQQPQLTHNPPQPRRPSPGLAARLKALGFGGSKKSTSPPPSAADLDALQQRVGRLDEARIHQLDENHQSNSAALVVERRGRPWKGASATFPFTKSPPPELVPATANLAITAPSTAPLSPAFVANDGASASASRPASIFLPEIEASEPLDMDTHKYRLPDHTNGNGTKVQLDTRREHIERKVRPPSPDDDLPPPPVPKDSPPLAPQKESTDFVPDLVSYFTPGHHRPGSIYTLSRASFANQLAQLTSLQLPDAESLSSRVSAIPTAQAAARALINAAEQIKSWVSKASEVIAGLDSDDDVEWAAAGGREGLSEVDNAVTRFEELINVYVSAIEELNRRPDISNVDPDDLNSAVAQMDSIMEEWKTIRATLQNIKGQVEIAMEWEELWNMVLGDIQNEMDDISRLVFEMEERRHKSLMAAATGEGVDIGDLETIVEETPPHQTRLHAQNRFSLPGFPLSPSSPNPTPIMSQDDGSLLALFARMQPLRASLDFLPMRLSHFEMRAEQSFPTACEELEMRRSGLDASYKKLEADVDSLGKELGEDKWVVVFRSVSRQAQKMVESVEKAVLRVKEAIDAGMHLTNQPMMSKKIESYEAKKTHYGPALERMLTMIDNSVKGRLTVNGEILRVHAELQSKWETIKDQMRDMDVVLEDIHADRKSQQLRDSISSMLSNDRSTIGSGNDTPGSSPPSSVIMSSLGLDPATPTPKVGKHRSSSIGSHLPQPANRRHSSMPMPTPNSQLTKKSGTAAASRLSMLSRPSSSDLTPIASSAAAAASKIQRPMSTMGMRPRWNTSTNTNQVDTGHNFKPLSLTTPSQYAKKSPTPARSISSLTPTSSGSKLPTLRSPITRAASESPLPADDTPSRTGQSRLSFRERIAASVSPGPYAHQNMQKPAAPRLASQASMSSLSGNRRASFQPRSSLQQQRQAEPGGGASLDSAGGESARPSRPASSLGSSSGRRLSMLPQPRTGPSSKKEGSVSGRESPHAIAGARVAMRKNSSSEGKPEPKDLKPRWRG